MNLIYNERTKDRKLAEHIVKVLRHVKAPNLKPFIQLTKYPNSDNNYIRVYVADVDYYQPPYWEEYHLFHKLFNIANELIYGKH